MTELSSEFPGPTPQLVVADADAAIGFYRKVFGADELLRNHAPDGRIMHSELLIAGGRLLVVDDFDNDPAESPPRLNGTTVRLHLYVPDVDEIYARALAEGATGLHGPEDAFWGDRYAMIRDPFGHLWSIATPNEDLSPADVSRRGDTWSGFPV